MRLLNLMAAAAFVASAVPAMATDFTFSGPISVPGGGPFGTGLPVPTFAVSGLGPVFDVNLTLLGLSHSFSDDLQIILISPTGTRILLMNDAGGNANWVDADVTFDQQASGVIRNTSLTYGGNNGTIPDGSYLPSNYGVGPLLSGAISGESLDLFNGENPNGIWTLLIRDTFLDRDNGSLAGVTLSIIAPPVPEPASWALMTAGLALVGGAMRRRTARVAASFA